MIDIFKDKQKTFSQQWEVFQKAGIKLNEGVDLNSADIRTRWGDETAYEESSDLLYVTLGQTLEREPWTQLTNQLINIDAERIEGNGSYVKLLEELAVLSGSDLPFSNITDVVDFDNEKAVLEFDLFGNHHVLDLMVNDDWIDDKFFVEISKLCDTYKTKRKFTQYLQGDQTIQIGFATREEVMFLREETGLDITWL